MYSTGGWRALHLKKLKKLIFFILRRLQSHSPWSSSVVPSSGRAILPPSSLGKGQQEPSRPSLTQRVWFLRCCPR